MKTITNSMSVLILITFLSSVFESQAQTRGRDNGNRNPGTDYSRENNSGRGPEKEYYDRQGKDLYADNSHKGRGSNHDHNKRNDDRDYSDRYRYDKSYRYPSRDAFRYSQYNSRDQFVNYRHHRNSHPSWAPAYGYRYNTRYIYYRDYNVYYDCHRDVFVIGTGRNWAISNRVPDVMYRVDFGRARVTGVDYWDDDFDFYLKRRSPDYIRISANW